MTLSFAFDNSYARLPERFYARVAPTKVREPRIIKVNHPLAALLGLDPAALDSAEGARILAILFDVFQQEKAIIALNKLNVIIPVIMAGAPMLGGFLNENYGFRSNFLAIALCVILSFAICLCFFDETLQKEKRVPFQAQKLLKDFMTVFGSMPFWQTTLIVSLLFSGYLAFLSTMSVLYVLEFEVSKQVLPYHQAALLGGWVGASLIYKPCIEKWGLAKIKTFGAIMCILGGLGFVLAAWLTSHNVYLFTSMMTLYAIGGNWINGIYFPEGMELFPNLKGITASLLTSARLLITAVIVGFTSHLYDATIFPVAAVIGGIVLAILTTLIFYERNKEPILGNRQAPHSIEIM